MDRDGGACAYRLPIVTPSTVSLAHRLLCRQGIRALTFQQAVSCMNKSQLQPGIVSHKVPQHHSHPLTAKHSHQTDIFKTLISQVPTETCSTLSPAGVRQQDHCRVSPAFSQPQHATCTCTCGHNGQPSFQRFPGRFQHVFHDAPDDATACASLTCAR
jgi:hypothetical protein